MTLDLIAARPLSPRRSPASSAAARSGACSWCSVLDAHRAIFTGDRDTLTLTFADVGTVVAAALEKLNPQLAADIDAGERVVLLKRDLGRLTADVVRAGEKLQVLAWVLGALTPRMPPSPRSSSPPTAGARARARDRHRCRGADDRDRVHRPRAPLVEGAATRRWDAYLGDLRAFGWVLTGAGAVVAAAAASLIAPIEIEGALRTAWRIATTEPHTTWLRLARAATLVAAGAPADHATAGGAAGRGHARRCLCALQGARDRPAHGLPAVPRTAGAGHAGPGAAEPRPPPRGPRPGPAADRRRRGRLRARRRHRGARAAGDGAATAPPHSAAARSTRSRRRRPTTRCRCRCRAGTRRSRSARSAASSRTGSAACCSTPTTATGSPAGGCARTSTARSSGARRRPRTR